MNPTKLLADQYVSVLRLFGDDLSRHDADRLLSMYSPWLRMHETSVEAADELRELVLARFPEPPAASPDVLSGDVWADIQADSKLIVDAMLAEDLAAVAPKTLSTDVTVADKQRSVRPGAHTEKMVVYRGEHSGWVGICVCGHQTAFFADRVSALLHLSSHIVKATELVEVAPQPSAEVQP